MNAAILIALAACALSCYFAACQIALKTFSRKRLAEFLAQRGREHQLEPFVEHLPQLLLLTGTLRTSFNLIVLLAVLYFVQTRFNFSDWGWLSGYEWLAYYLISFLITGVLVSIFGVAIAVSLARYSREPLLGRSIPLFNVVLVVLKPLASFLHLFDPLVRRLSGADLTRSEDHPLTDQVLSVVEEHEHDVGQVVDEAQKEMLEAVFELPTTSAGEIMTPRTEVRGIEVGASLEEVKRAIQEYGYSRIPVYQENLDNIVGILYTKDLIRFLGDGDPFDLRAVLREPFMVPESKSVRELLAEFKARKVHMAVVLDEYGGTAGLVTIEDVLEEIVGEIRDEYEVVEEPPQIQRIDENTAEVDARLHVDDFNDAIGVQLPEDEDYDTVGGFVFATLGRIPKAGESFDYANVRFTITAVERTKVKRVRVERLQEQPASANGSGAPKPA